MIKAHANLDEQRIDLESQWRDKERIKLVPGSRWDRDKEHWFCPLTWAACKQLRGIFGDDLYVAPSLHDWATREYIERIQPAMTLRTQMNVEPWHGDPRLYSYQRVGVDFLTISGQALMADEMGTGKTFQTIAAIEALGPEALPALVVCPNSMKRVWEREIKQWSRLGLKAQVISGGAQTRRKQFKEEADVYIINWEALRIHSRLSGYGSIALSDKEKEDKELNIPWGTVVADEAHRAKNPKAKQTRALWQIGDTATYRFALTGTPIANTPDELWSIMRFISPDEWPARTRYIDRYCLSSWNPFGGLDILGVKPETKEEFYSIVDPRFIRRIKEAVLPDLPPKIYQTRYVEMNRKQARAYKQMRDHYIALLDDDASTIATNPLVHLTRLSQFACAYADVNEDGKLVLSEPSCKLDALDEIYDEVGDLQIVVFAESRQLIQLAEKRAEKQGIEYVSIHGDVGEAMRDINIEKFQGGKAKVCFVTLGAGGEGITLTAGSVAVFLQRSWSPIKNKQGEDRLHRPGQDADKVEYIDLVTEDTVEEERLLRLDEKEGRFQEIVRDKATLKALLTGK